MRLAIISDIHANLEALETALKIIREHNIDETICLGDIVGYGANPNECLEIIREHTQYIILGNHDEAASDLSMAEYFNPYARTAIEWTHTQLTKKGMDFLRNLPHTMQRHGLFFVHSSPFQPGMWHYILSSSEARKNFQFFLEPICFVGHSHVPSIFCEDSKTEELERGKRFIINVGSVGQPRDRNPGLSIGIFDTDARTYENIRAGYDIAKAADKILEAGLPEILAERLFKGR